MRELLYGNLSKNTLSLKSDGATAFTFPNLVQNETLILGWRPAVNKDGTPVATARTVQAMRFAIGRRDTRPASGTFRLQLGNPAAAQVEGTNLTTALPYNISAADLQTALNALSAKPAAAVVTEDQGSYLVTFEGITAETQVTIRKNLLRPVSVLEKSGYGSESGGDWVIELRLTQAPVVFEDSYEALLAPPPTIEEVLAGGTSGDTTWDEVQKLTVDPRFEGSFILKRGVKKTLDALTLADMADPELVAERLAAIADEDGVFIVTSVADNAVHIRFSGDGMSGTDHALIEIEVIDAPDPDPTITVRLTTAELNAILRGAKNGNNTAEIKLPWEWEIDLENEADSELTDTHKFKGEVVITAAVNLEQFANPANIDWLRPPSPVNYKARGTGQIANGVLHWSGPIGDNSSTTFVIDHDLASDIVFPVIRQNQANGELLLHGTDYIVAFNSDNSLTITMLGDYATTPPDVDALVVYVMAFGAASQYDPHTHSIAEVDGLQAILDAHAADIAALQEQAGAQSLGTSDLAAGSKVMEFALPTFLDAYPLRYKLLDAASAAVAGQISGGTVSQVSQKTASGTTTTTTTTGSPAASQIAAIADVPLSILPPDAPLLPAIHDAAAEALPDPLPLTSLSSYKGKLYQNQTGDDVRLPGTADRESVILKDDEYASCDGKSWFKVFQPDAAKTTWHPSDFERTLFDFAVNEDQLTVKRVVEVRFGLELAMMSVDTQSPRVSDKHAKAQWRLLIEWGTKTSESSPATTGPNIKGISWNATPILDKTIELTYHVPTVHTFGARVKRTAASTFVTEKNLYGTWQASAAEVNAANFFLRARLTQWDIEDIDDPRGFVLLFGCARAITAAASDIGKAIIK